MAMVAVYVDNDVSATKRRKRPEFERMLDDPRAGEFDLIVSYHLDRLTRTIGDLIPLLELAVDHGAGTTTVSGEIDLTTDVGRLVARILAVVAHAEVERKAARQVVAARQRAEQGKPNPGPRPLGFEPDMVTIRRSEATVIRQAYKTLLAGGSVSHIARDLNAKGLTTSRGAEWKHYSVRQLLTNPRYAGLRGHLGEVVGPAAWKPIVDEPTWGAAVALLGNPARRTDPHAGGHRTQLLTGVTTCGGCQDGTTVVSGARGGKVATYHCRNGKHLSWSAAPLDSYLRSLAIARLSREDAASPMVDPATPDLDALRRGVHHRRQDRGDAA